MSLINKVLKDLQARERVSDGAPPRPMLEDLRAAPPSVAKSPAMALAGVTFVVGLLCIAGAAAWYWYGMRPTAAVVSRPISITPKVSTPLAPKPNGPVAQFLPLPTPTAAPATSAGPPKAIFERLPSPSPSQPPKAQSLPPRPLVRPLPHRKLVRTTRPPRPSSGVISRRAVLLTPVEQSQTLYRQAIAALQQGRSRQARSDLKKALVLDAGDLRPRLLLSALDVQGGHLNAAHVLLTQGLVEHPHALAVALLLAQVDLRQGRPENAVQVLSRLAQTGAQSEPYWALLAASQLRAGDAAGAIVTYHQALQRFASNGALWVGLGLAELNGEHTRAARKALVQAQKCQLSPVLSHFVQGELAQLP